jgi:hypothetical protein
VTRRAKILASTLVAIILAIAVALVIGYVGGGEVSGGSDGPTAEANPVAHPHEKRARLEWEVRKAQLHLKMERRQTRNQNEAHPVQAASAGNNGSPGQTTIRHSIKPSPDEAASFASLQSEISGEVGVAFAPLGSAAIQEYGGTAVDHAWSSFKVPIVVTLMLEQHGALSTDQEALAASAITASDNSAAASLFSDLEGVTGGNAAGTVEAVISQLPDGATQVATAPPPPGAYSSWGQTDWTLTAATAFYGAMACGQFGEVSNVLADMESIIPEQQWGLGQSSFPAGVRVAYKAGWGPDGSESGPYLVRQSGVIRSADGRGVAVTLGAQDASGSFEAGVADLDRVAAWVAEHVPLSGSC